MAFKRGKKASGLFSYEVWTILRCSRFTEWRHYTATSSFCSALWVLRVLSRALYLVFKFEGYISRIHSNRVPVDVKAGANGMI